MEAAYLPLPSDIRYLVRLHIFAMRIQQRIRRWRMYGHARLVVWEGVVQRLGRRAIRALYPFETVRREWRTETSNWLSTDAQTAAIILEEAASGLWGCTDARMAGCLAASHQ